MHAHCIKDLTCVESREGQRAALGLFSMLYFISVRFAINGFICVNLLLCSSSHDGLKKKCHVKVNNKNWRNAECPV